MFDVSLFQLFFWLLVAHAVCDFPLQGEYLANAKNRNTELGKAFSGMLWPWHLFCHSLIHGGAVAYVTGSITLGCAEVMVHMVTDFLKTENKIGYATDQAIHVLSKLLWAVLAISMNS